VAFKPIEGRYIDNFEKHSVGLLNTLAKTGTESDYIPSNIVTTESICEEMDKVFLVKKPTKAEKGESNTHVSVKPVELIQHLINLFTKENAIVLDPFMGSGTAAVACKASGRQYIGYEINPSYIEITRSRLTP
jgi:site-specific DNA-methyltransferase (adenine-specific)